VHVDASSSVAMKLLLVSRRDGGQLRRTPWCGVCLRAGLFVDMFFEGRLHDDLNGYSLVTTPTGFLPADELLKAVEREPDRSLASWIGKGPSVRDALAEQWVREEVLWKKPRGLHRHPATDSLQSAAGLRPGSMQSSRASRSSRKALTKPRPRTHAWLRSPSWQASLSMKYGRVQN
jgi:hypothetical protein